MNRISDLRNAPAELHDAISMFNRLAQSQIALAARDAMFEKQAARLKAAHVTGTESDREALKNMESDLMAFIQARRDLFKDPRKIKTDFGSFGLQTVSDVVVKNEERVIEDMLDKGYDDCVQITRKLLKSALRTRLDDGEKFPGVTLRSGDTAVYKVDKSLLDKAKSQAE